MSTFKQLQSGFIRERVLADIADWPPAQAAQARTLLAATAAAQLVIDNHVTNPAIPPEDTANRLDSWDAAFKVVSDAVHESAVLARANPGTVKTTVDGLGYSHHFKVFEPEGPAREQPTHPGRV
jgi:hypothetical protein